MRFKLDENLPSEAGDLVRARGHEADSVLDERLGGAADPAIAQICQREQRILITLDLDFSDIRHFPPSDYPGIIVLRPARQDRDAVLGLISRLLTLLPTEPIAQCLWVVDETRTRIKGDGDQGR